MINFLYHQTDPLAGSVQRLLRLRQQPFTEIELPFRSSTEFHPIEDNPSANWLVADAHSPAAPAVMPKAGRKFGFIRHLKLFKYDPSPYDTLFMFSRFGQQVMSRYYPQLKICLCRIPFDPNHYLGYCCAKKQKNQLVFIQPFTTESLHILEVYYAEILAGAGFHVYHLFNGSLQEQDFIEHDKCLLRAGELLGMDFVFCSNPESYYTRLAQAEVVMTLGWSHCISSLLAAAAMGVNVVAPAYGFYPEFFAQQNLFPPLNLERAISLAISSPINNDGKENIRFPSSCDFIEMVGI